MKLIPQVIRTVKAGKVPTPGDIRKSRELSKADKVLDKVERKAKKNK